MHGKLPHANLPPLAVPVEPTRGAPIDSAQATAASAECDQWISEALGRRAEITWAEELGIAIEPDTDFFDAGGTSQMAMRIIAGMQGSCPVPIPLRTIFDQSRFCDFVRVIAEIARGQAGGPTPV